MFAESKCDNFVPSQNHTATCEFLKIPCVHPECGVLVKKADLTEHLEKECMYRLEQCRYCQRQINLNRMKVNANKYFTYNSGSAIDSTKVPVYYLDNTGLVDFRLLVL